MRHKTSLTAVYELGRTRRNDMNVHKLRVSAQDQGLVPAGRYFEKLAQELRAANESEAARREKLDAQDRRLEARYRKASAARGATFVQTDIHAPM
jgi:hypothetical protein